LRTDLLIKSFPNLDKLSEGLYVTSAHSRFPDLIYILSPGYIQFTRSFDNMSRLNWENVDEFIPELMKRESFLLEFPDEKPKALSPEIYNVSVVDTQNGLISLVKIVYGFARRKFIGALRIFLNAK